jgi:potassium-dependent mechanosensitive channel
MLKVSCLLPLAAWLVLAPDLPAAAQAPGRPAAQAAADQEAGGPPEAARPPGAFEVATRARQVTDSAAVAERTIEQLATVRSIAAEVEELRRRHGELQALLSAMADADFVRPERVSRLRDQALVEDQRLEGLHGRAVERIEQLGEVRTAWIERQRFWRSWQQQLRGDPDFAAVARDMAGAIARIDSVVAAAGGALTHVLEVQRDIDDLRSENAQLRAGADAIRVGGRAALAQRPEPVLFSQAHRAQLAEGGWRAWNPLAHVRLATYLAFLREHAGLLLVQLLLIAAVAFAVRRFRVVAGRTAPARTGAPRAAPEGAAPEGATAVGSDDWSGLLEHPWALGVFVAAVFLLQRVMLAPPLWDVVLWAVFGATAALLSRALFAAYSLRLTVYLLAVFYPVFLGLEVAQLPTPVFRTGLAAVAAVALPTFLLLARRRAAVIAAADGDPRRIWPLRVGAAMWLVVLVTTIAGYDALGRWVLHASITSAGVVFIAVVLLALVRGALAVLVHVETAEGRRFASIVGVRLAQRLMVIIRVVAVVIATLVVLDVWQLTGSPLATWQRITGTGFDVGPIHITIGRLLVGAVVIWMALLVSWLIRGLVESEAYRRWDFDRGVGESINALVHYSLVALAFILALAALGVELQNFAIVAGALGIGIGFGLQNIVSNFVAGLILLFERPVRVGDTVVVSGEWGTIRKIGLRSTIMQTFDQSEMIVPNADLVSEKVVNWTLSNPIARVIMPIGVAYGSSIPQVLEILRAAGPAHASVLHEPPPQALFVGFGDSSLDFELRVWVNDIRQRLEVRSIVLADVERRLGEAGIEIPFPQRDLHVRTMDPRVAEAMRAPGP